MSARLNSRNAKLTVIQVYTPTNNPDDDSKEEFYEQLQWVIKRLFSTAENKIHTDLQATV